jgi:hypothetical protein
MMPMTGVIWSVMRVFPWERVETEPPRLVGRGGWSGPAVRADQWSTSAHTLRFTA